METTIEKTYLSRKGMKELRKEITRLEKLVDQCRRDLHELDKSSSYEERLTLIEKLAQLEQAETELVEKRALHDNAVQLPRKRDALKVAIGSVVELLDAKGQLVRYTLVESFEANPSDGRISVKSPLGRNLVGKQIKELVEWTAGQGRQHQFRLVNIA